MATIASLNVSLRADSSAFTKGLKSASGALNSFMSGLGGIQGLLAGVGAFFAGNEIVQFVNKQMQAIDASAKLADSLNADIATLEAYSYSASLAGSSTEEFSAALQKQTATLGEALQGGKTQQDAFARLGLDPEALSRMDSTAAFTEIADAISKIENPAKRAAAAVDIFGKAGVKLLPTLMQGRAGLQASVAEYEKLAGAINRTDAAQIEAANDALSKIGVALSSIGRAIAIEVAPFITTLANNLLENAGRFAEMRDMAREAINAIVTGFGYAYDTLQFFATGINVIRAGLAKLVSAIATELDNLLAKAEFAATVLGQGGIASGIAAARSEVQSLALGFSQTGDELIELATRNAEAFGKGTEMATRFRESVTTTATEIASNVKQSAQVLGDTIADNMQRGLDAYLKHAEKAFEALKSSAKSIFESTRTPMEQFQAKLEELANLGAMGLLDPETIARAGQQALEQLSSALPTFSRAGGLRQIDTSLMSVAGLQQQAADVQEVYSPQLDTANKQLTELNKQFKGLTLGAVAQ